MAQDSMVTQGSPNAVPETVREVASVICKAVNLHHIDPNSLNGDTLLMEGGMGLDSVDVLEAVLAIEHHFNVKIDNSDEGKKHFRSLSSIAEFVESKKSLS